MEKRLVLFCVLTAALLGVHMLVQSWLNPPRPKLQRPVAAGQQPGDDVQTAGPDAAPGQPSDQPSEPDGTAAEPTQPDDQPSTATAKPTVPDDGSQPTPPPVEAAKTQPRRWVTLGSLDPASPYRLLVTLTSQGAGIERIEVASPRYRDVVDRTGYLGNLNLQLDDAAPVIGCVGSGTPAALAEPASAEDGVGLRVGDVLVAIDGQPVASAEDLTDRLAGSRPGNTWKIEVRRDDRTLSYTVTLSRHPLAVIRPESIEGTLGRRQNPPSCLFTLATVGNNRNQASADDGGEIAGLPSLATGDWELVEATPEMAEFRWRIDAPTLAKVKQAGDLEIVRRYRVARVPDDKLQDADYPSYHVELEIELRTSSEKGVAVSGRMSGPNGLPLEGWWYTTKISGNWSGCGARDIVLRTDREGHRLIAGQSIYKQASNDKNPDTVLFTSSDQEGSRTLRYLGVDAQYFAAMLLPKPTGPRGPVFRAASAMPVGDINRIAKDRARTLNVSFQLETESQVVKADAPVVQQYVLFAGPKHPDLLYGYGEKTANGYFDLGSLLEYGWFGWVARPLSRILHFIYAVVGNYGIAIILLTVLVRSCMLPISHKAAKNTQKMQLLAPEMKRIAELYKNDMEKRGRAQQELYRKYNINPFSGCLLALCQLPIFIGLYRCLSVDIELRQASLLPGIDWASNLSGPDMLMHWKNFLPSFIADETGYLGPYFNLLPLITIGLFLFNQKLLTPPPTDEQTRMQHKIMMGMTVVIGVMFFKVPAGLCIYFISSSIWSLTEHKLLRKQPAKSTA